MAELQTKMSTAEITSILISFIALIGVFWQAYPEWKKARRGEKTSNITDENTEVNTMGTVIQTLREENARLLAETIRLKQTVELYINKVRDSDKDRSAYAVAYLKSLRLLRMYAPKDVKLPEVEINGITPAGDMR